MAKAKAKDILIYEKYRDVDAFYAAISSRENNIPMKSANSATRGDDWTGTASWDEALELYRHGKPERVVALRQSLDRIRAQCNAAAETSKVRPRNYYYGHAPNVPAAMAGMPKSMRQNVRQPQKVKTVNIVYDMGIVAYTDAAEIERGGETVLQLVAMLEHSGYRVQLDMCPYTGHRNNLYAAVVVTLKEFKQPLDLLKLSFPLGSASMFRRFGFRWLETVPALDDAPRATAEGFAWGYGTPLEPEETAKQLETIGYRADQTHVIKLQTVRAANFDPRKLAEQLKIAR